MNKLSLTLLFLSAVAQAQPAAVVMQPVTQLKTTVGTFKFKTPLLTPRASDQVRTMTSPAISSYFRDMEQIARDNKLGRFCGARYLLAKRNLPLDQTVAFTTEYHTAQLPYLKGVSSSTEYTEFTNELGRQRQMVSIMQSKRTGAYWMNLFTYSMNDHSLVITACELK